MMPFYYDVTIPFFLLLIDLVVIYRSVRLYHKFANRYFLFMAAAGMVTLFSPVIWNSGAFLSLANFIGYPGWAANRPVWSITLVSIVELIPLFLTVYAAAFYRESYQDDQPSRLTWGFLLAPVAGGFLFWPAVIGFLLLLNSSEVLTFFRFILGNMGYGGFLAVIVQTAVMLALVAAAVTELSLLRRYRNPFFGKMVFASLAILASTLYRVLSSLVVYVTVIVAPRYPFRPGLGTFVPALGFWALGLAAPVLTAYAFVTYRESAVETPLTTASTRFRMVHGDRSDQ